MLTTKKLRTGIHLPRAAYERLARLQETRENRKKVKLIKRFIRSLKEQQTAYSEALRYLNSQHEGEAIDDETYERLQRVLDLSNEMKQVEMAELTKGNVTNDNNAEDSATKVS